MRVPGRATLPLVRKYLHLMAKTEDDAETEAAAVETKLRVTAQTRKNADVHKKLQVIIDFNICFA